MLTVDFEYFDLRPGDVCVDLGCGEGRHSLTAYLQEDVTLIGLDLSPVSYTHLRAHETS